MSVRSSPPSRPVRRFLRWMRSVLYYEHWMVGIIDQPIANALSWKEAPPIRWIAPFDKGSYFADPFPWPHSADTLMCEEYDISAREGHIAVLKLNANGVADRIKADLPIKGHLSFPFVFYDRNRVFAMPESSVSKRLEIFEWDEKTGAWHSHALVFDDKAVADAALHHQDGYYWISYTDVSSHPHDNLNLIYASALTGPWLRHPSNPVQKGRELSRNGGAVFEVDGKRYRPAQDCSSLYGGALRIMHVRSCTPTTYEEHEVTRITPSAASYPDGFHTLVAWGDRCLVDGMRLVFSPRLVWSKFVRRLRR